MPLHPYNGTAGRPLSVVLPDFRLKPESISAKWLCEKKRNSDERYHTINN